MDMPPMHPCEVQSNCQVKHANSRAQISSPVHTHIHTHTHACSRVSTYIHGLPGLYHDIIQKLGSISTIVCILLSIRDMHSFIRACSYIRTHIINTPTYKVSYHLRRYAVFTGLAFQPGHSSIHRHRSSAWYPSLVKMSQIRSWSCKPWSIDPAIAGNSSYQLIWHSTPITRRTSTHFWNGLHVLHELLQPVCT